MHAFISCNATQAGGYVLGSFSGLVSGFSHKKLQAEVCLFNKQREQPKSVYTMAAGLSLEDILSLILSALKERKRQVDSLVGFIQGECQREDERHAIALDSIASAMTMLEDSLAKKVAEKKLMDAEKERHKSAMGRLETICKTEGKNSEEIERIRRELARACSRRSQQPTYILVLTIKSIEYSL